MNLTHSSGEKLAPACAGTNYVCTHIYTNFKLKEDVII